jgi:hypothetical protein
MRVSKIQKNKQIVAKEIIKMLQTQQNEKMRANDTMRRYKSGLDSSADVPEMFMMTPPGKKKSGGLQKL